MKKPDIKADRKRRLSSLTFVIMAVNIIPLLIMGLGIFYLDKYKQNLIEAAYVDIDEKGFLIAALLEKTSQGLDIIEETWPNGKSVYYIDKDYSVIDKIGKPWRSSQNNKQEEDAGGILNFTEVFADIFIYLNPLKTTFPTLPEKKEGEKKYFKKFPEIVSTFEGIPAFSAWSFEETFILTSTTSILNDDGNVDKVILITMTGDEITQAIDEVRRDIIQGFVFVIILTFFLSVYLSSFIAIPLKKLGRAAEDIRRGKRDLTDLPDLSNRKDEIGELSTILRQMTKALDNRIDTIQNFAADVSHEIKNPITSIRSAIETALALDDKEKRDGLLKIMEQDVYRLDKLISDISRHSRLDSELARDSYQVISLNKVLHDIVDLWKNPINRKGLSSDDIDSGRVRLIVPNEEYYILAKGESLGQVFQNLISNALSFHTGNSPIIVQLIKTQDTNDILVLVEDSGPGIPEGQFNKIFDRFYSDRPKDHDIRQNSGLGLSIAKQIIEAHDGEINVQNIKNPDNNEIEGARFIVKLKSYNI